MDTFLIKATQLILALAILVIIHEFGHFLFARIFGVRVNKFYIFFNPVTSLFKWRPGKYVGFGKKKHHFDPAIDKEDEAVRCIEDEISKQQKEIDLKIEPLEKQISNLKRQRMFAFFQPSKQTQIDSEIIQTEAQLRLSANSRKI